MPVAHLPELRGRRTVNLAVAKGRLLRTVIEHAENAGIAVVGDPLKDRNLIFSTKCSELRLNLVVVRSQDIPAYVEYGAADLGIVGKDVLVEVSHEYSNFYELSDLSIACCRLVVAGREDGPSWADWQLGGRKRIIRVASKYVSTARNFFLQNNLHIQLIKLYGSMELAPILGLSDLIVDLVDTGNTLAANRLREMAHIIDVSARLIANKSAAKIKMEAIRNSVAKLEQISSLARPKPQKEV